jgi:hypothetical protein
MDLFGLFSADTFLSNTTAEAHSKRARVNTET